MKNLLLKTMVLALVLLGGAVSTWAQSTYTWDATKWTANCGNISINDGKIVGTEYNKWGCIQIKTENSFKLPKRQTFLVIKGENLFNDDNNPNVFDLNGTNSGLKNFTINEAKTLAYVDITSILPAETDFFGNVTISSFGITLDQDGENTTMPTINSIEFVAADFIDAATSIEFSKENTFSGNTVSASTGEFKKTLSFKQTSTDGDFGIKFNVNTTLNNSDTYFVIESNVNDNGKLKVRNLTIGDNAWGNNGVASSKVFTISEGHYVVISSPIGTNSDTAGEMWSYYQNNSIVPVTYCQLYIKNEQNKDVEIYRAGMYNLGEILALYPSLKASNDWQFVFAERPRIETNGTGGNTVKLKGGSDNVSCTVKQFISLIRTLGNMPSEYTTFNLHGNTTLTEDASNVQYKQDFLSDFTGEPTVMFHPTFYKYFPTMSQKIKISNGNYKYYQYKEGVAPLTSYENPMSDGAGNTSIASLTCQFVKDFNTLTIPFDVMVTDLTALGVTPYILSSFNDGIITFAKATGTITANTPIIVDVTEEGLYLIPSASAPNISSSVQNYYPAEQNNAKFVGSYVNTAPTGDYASTSNFAITASGIQKMGAEETTDYYRAFLSLPAGYDVQGNGNFTVAGDNITVSVGSAYAITVPDAVAGNSIAADKTTAVAGTTITLTPTLATGYQLTELKYNETTIDLSEVKESYTFVMPAAAVTITAKYGKVEKQNADSEKEVTETINLTDATHAEVTAVNISNDATSVSIPASVDGIPVTSIAAGVFTAENTANVQSIDLSNTQVDLDMARDDASSPVKDVPANTLVYLPSGCSMTGNNVVIKTGTDTYSCTNFVMEGGNSTGKSYNVPKAFTATNVSLNREFDENVAATVCLPYALTQDQANGLGKFYYFSSVTGNTVNMTQVTTGGLESNKPYMFLPNSTTGSADAVTATNVTVSIANSQTSSETGGSAFTFQGVIADKTFTTDEIAGGIYGFAAEADHGASSVGQFVKCSNGAYVKAFRAYLICATNLTGEQLPAGARGLGESEALPDVLYVTLINGDGSTTSIGKLELIEIDDNTPRYNLSGQRVGKDYKGIVIINGKKVFIK